MNTAIKKLPVVETTIHAIPLEFIEENSLNPRLIPDLDSPPQSEAEEALRVELRELGESMMQVGQIDAVRVRPMSGEGVGKFELVDGTRRCLAARLVGITSIRAEVGAFTDEHVLLYAFTTGTKRRQLSAIEEAEGFRKAIDRGVGTQVSIASIIGKSEGYVAQRMALLALPKKSRQYVQDGVLPARTAYFIARLPDEVSRLAAEELIVAPNGVEGTVLSSRRAEELVNEMFGERAKMLEARKHLEEISPEHVLSVEDNDRVFPHGAELPDPSSGYVAWTRPIPDHLLKPEVIAEGAPKMCDIAGDVTVRLAVNKEGHAVEVVKLDEAVTSVAKEDAEIFKRDVVRKYGVGEDEKKILDLASKDSDLTASQIADRLGMTVDYVRGVLESSTASSSDKSSSIVADEKKAKKEKAKADRERAKRSREAEQWLKSLFAALVEKSPRPMAFWSLLLEHELARVSDDEALVVARALAGEPGKGQKPKAFLSELSSAYQYADEVCGLVVCLQLVSALTAGGCEAKWALEWTKHVVDAPAEEPRGDAEDADKKGVLEKGRLESRDLIGQVKRAYEGGMSAHKIARTFDTTLGDICVILGLVEADEEAHLEGLDAELRRVLDAQGLKSRKALDKVAGFACGKSFEEATLPEEITAMLRFLRKEPATVPIPPDVEEEDAA